MVMVIVVMVIVVRVIVVMVIVVMVIVVMVIALLMVHVYYLGLAASFPPSNLVPNCPNGCSKFTLLLPT